VAANGKPMHFITNALQVVHGRAFGVDRKGWPVRHEEAFAPGIAIRPFGDGNNGDVGNAQIFHDFTHGR